MVKKIIIKQTMGDGRVYYYAGIEIVTKWLFGLLVIERQTLGVFKANTDYTNARDYVLSEMYHSSGIKDSQPFTSIESARDALEDAIRYRIAETRREKVEKTEIVEETQAIPSDYL